MTLRLSELYFRTFDIKKGRRHHLPAFLLASEVAAKLYNNSKPKLPLENTNMQFLLVDPCILIFISDDK
jgi:hypothetical protein